MATKTTQVKPGTLIVGAETEWLERQVSLSALKTSDAGQSALTKDQLVFLGTIIIEAARMLSVRDGSPSPDHFKNYIPIVTSLYNNYFEEGKKE